jgi:sulfate permease, SulP family
MDLSQKKRRILPTPILSLRWLANYRFAFLSSDLMAGMTLAAFTLPQTMAYAGLAGLPCEAGLYAAISASIAYLFFGTSRQMTVGPASALSVLVASGFAAFSISDPVHYAAMAAMTAILVAAICFICWFLRLGFLVHFLSEPVLTGFSAGAALFIGMTQLNKLFGIHGSEGEFFERLIFILGHIGDIHLPSLILGVSSIVFLITGPKYFPKLPISLIVVATAILIMSYTGIADQGIAIVGKIPKGLPDLSFPPLSLHSIQSLLPLAIAVFLLSYIEGISSARTFAKKYAYEINAGQELFALGAANVFSGLFQGYPVGGSLSRSAVNDRSGAKTQLAAAFSAILLVLVLLFFTEAFTRLPETVLAAIVLVAVKGLFNLTELIRLYRIKRAEFWNAMAALVGVLLFGLLEGVLIGAVISILILVRNVVFAKVIPVGRVRGTDYFVDMSRYSDLEVLPGVAIYALNARVFYANCHTVKMQILELVEEKAPLPDLVILNMPATVEIDLMAADMLGDLSKEFKEKNIHFRIASSTWPVRDILKKIGHEDIYGGVEHPQSVMDILTTWKSR